MLTRVAEHYAPDQLEIDRGGYGCHSPLMSATVDSFFDEYARRYTEGDVEDVTSLCLWPFLAVRRGRRSTCRTATQCGITSLRPSPPIA
jgi:hypothetical protein